MALSFNFVKTFSENIRLRWRIVDITMDNAYPTGGWALSAANLKLGGILAVMPIGQEDGYVPVWDRSAGKLKMFYCDYDAVADGALIECPASLAGLNSKILTCLVLGY